MQLLINTILSIVLIWIYAQTKDPAYDVQLQNFAFVGMFPPVFALVLFLRSKDFRHAIIFAPTYITWSSFLSPYLFDHKVKHYIRHIPSQFLPAMALSACLAIYLIAIGYYFFIKKRLRPFFNISYELRSSEIGNIILLLIPLSYIALAITKSLPSIKSFFYILELTPTLVVALLVLYGLKSGRNPLIWTIGVVYIITETLYYVAQTLFGLLALIYIGGFVLYVIKTKRFPYLAAVLAILILLPVYFTRWNYRKLAMKWWYGNQEISKFEIIKKGANNVAEISKTWNYNQLFEKDAKDQNGISYKYIRESRVEQISYLAQLMYMHHYRNRPFVKGATFWWLPLAPIPRILIPFKPESKIGTEFAAEYGLKNKRAKGAMNFPLLAEYYINFGYIGVLLLSLIQGLVLRFIVEKIHFERDDLNLFILISLIFPLLRVDTNIILVYGVIIQLLIVWWVITRFIAKLMPHRVELIQ